MIRPPKPRVVVAALIIALIWLAAFIVQYFALFQKSPFDEGAVELQKNDENTESRPYKISEVAFGLKVPWDVVFTSPDRMLVTERPGAIRVVQNGQLLPNPLATLQQVSSKSEEGLMGLSVDPDYSKNRFLYACYATQSGSGLIDRVVRFEDLGTTIGPLQTIVDNIPAATNHAGCRIDFGPDKKLYITTGDATDKNIAQQLDSLGGKILRVNSDGSMPTDNPFPNSPVWTLGHRNSQGIAWQPKTNEMYATEHGPSLFDGPAGGDEINRIEEGKNYGWPIVSHEKTDPRYVSPVLVFTPAIAPSGAVFYNSNVLPQFNGNLLFSGLRGEGLFRVIFTKNDPSKIARYEKLSDINFGRIREVTQGPDGAIYFTTSNTDSRGTPRSNDDKVYKIHPQ